MQNPKFKDITNKQKIDLVLAVLEYEIKKNAGEVPIKKEDFFKALGYTFSKDGKKTSNLVGQFYKSILRFAKTSGITQKTLFDFGSKNGERTAKSEYIKSHIKKITDILEKYNGEINFDDISDNDKLFLIVLHLLHKNHPVLNDEFSAPEFYRSLGFTQIDQQLINFNSGMIKYLKKNQITFSNIEAESWSPETKSPGPELIRRFK